MSIKKGGYAWIILATCFVLNMTVHCLVMQMASFYVVPMYNDLQVPRTLLSLQSVAISVGAMLMAPVWGKVYKKHDARFVVALCTGMTTLCTIGRSFMPNIWAILVLAVVKGIFFAGATMLPVSILLTVWFRKKRGLAVSIAAIGISVGNVIFSPVVESLISTFGWRGSDQITGLFCFVFMVPISLLLMTSRPASRGLAPYGMEDGGQATDASKKSAEVWGMTAAEARKTPLLYLFLAAILCISFAIGASLQMPAYLTDIGYGSAGAAKVLSAGSAIAIFGKLLMGAVCDKFGIKIGSIYACVSGILLFVCFTLAGNFVALVGLAVFYGLATGISTVLPTLLTVGIFGNRDYDVIYGMVTSANFMAGVLGSVGVMVLYDITGSYTIIWPLCTVAMVLALVFSVFCLNHSAKIAKSSDAA